jgi:hypothetical protein
MVQMFSDDLSVFSSRICFSFMAAGLLVSESQPCGAVVDIAVGEDDSGLAVGVHSSVQPAVSKHTAVDQQPKTGEC